MRPSALSAATACSASVTGLLSGEVDAAMCNTPEGMSNVDAGQLKILCSFASKHFKDYPDVPLAIESSNEALKDLESLIEEAKAEVEALRDEIKTEMLNRDTEELEAGAYGRSAGRTS